MLRELSHIFWTRNCSFNCAYDICLGAGSFLFGNIFLHSLTLSSVAVPRYLLGGARINNATRAHGITSVKPQP